VKSDGGRRQSLLEPNRDVAFESQLGCWGLPGMKRGNGLKEVRRGHPGKIV
jgi:hypothetical protein